MKRDSLIYFETIYKDHQSLIRGVIYKLIPTSEIDDLVQEAFIRVWRGLPGFRNNSQLSTWIYKIAVNTALDSLKKRKIVSYSSSDQIIEVSSTADNCEAQDLVRKGVELLDYKHRPVFVLSMLEDKTIHEVGDILEISEGTVKSRLFYAKKVVTDFFRENGVVL